MSGLRRLALALGLATLAPAAHAAGRAESGALDTTLSRRVHLPYRVHLPAGYEPRGRSWPLILFLHGSGERGSDRSEERRVGKECCR